MAGDTKPLRGANPTRVYVPTRRLDRGDAADAGGVGGWPVFPPDEELVLKSPRGGEYVIDPGVILGHGGEAVVHGAKDADGVEYAARITRLLDPDAQNANEAVLGRLISYGTTAYRINHLMPLLDFGQTTATEVGAVGPALYNVAIFPKCQSLDGHDATPDVVKREILPGLAEALHSLHVEGIVHRDVKPDNVYRLNGTVVLGDFGISGLLEEGRNRLRTRTERGTTGYYLPGHHVSRAADWYGFGYTIWTLYKGNNHPLQDRIDTDQMEDVETGEYYPTFTPALPGDESLDRLLRWLVEVREDCRAGYEEVLQWMHNPAAFDRQVQAAASPAAVAYDFGGRQCQSNAEIVDAFAHDWGNAKRHFRTTALEDYFRGIGQQQLATDINDIKRHGADEDLMLAQALFLISGKTAMYWRGMDASFPVLIERFENSDANGVDAYDGLFASGFLSWVIPWRENLDAVQRGRFESLLRIVESAASDKDNPQFARNLFSHFLVGGGASPYAGGEIDSMDALVGTVLRTPREFYRIVDSDSLVNDLFAAIARLSIKVSKSATQGQEAAPLDINGAVQVLEARERLSPRTKFIIRANQLLFCLESLDASSGRVARFAFEYGPDAPWIWVARHAGMYKRQENRLLQGKTPGNGDDVARALAKLKQIGSQRVSSVDDVKTRADEALRYVGILKRGLDDSPLVSQLELQTDKPYRATEEDALFCAEFYGLEVTRGFVRSLLGASGLSSDGEWPEVFLLSDNAAGRPAAGKIRQAYDAAKEACKKNSREVGITAGGVAGRVVFDACMLAFAVLAASSAGGAISSFVAYAVGAADAGAVQGANVFSFVALLSIAVFSAFDAATVLSMTGVVSNAQAAVERCDAIHHSCEELSAEFTAGRGKYADSLRNVGSSAPFSGGALGNELAQLGSVASKGTSPIQGKLYRWVWYLTTIAPALLISFFAGALVVSVGQLANYGINMVFSAIIAFCAAGIAMQALKQQSMNPMGLLSSYGWLGSILLPIPMVVAVAIPIVLVVVVVYIVGSILGGIAGFLSDFGNCCCLGAVILIVGAIISGLDK